MTKQEALREIWRRWHDTPEAEWRGKLEEWVAELLTDPTYDEGYRDGVSEHEDDYENGHKEGQQDLCNEIGMVNPHALREWMRYRKTPA